MDKKKIIELLIIILILTDTILLLITIFYNFPSVIMTTVYIFDIIVCIVLSIDYIFEFRNSDNKKQFFKYNWFYIIAFIPDYLLTILFSFFGFGGASGLIRLIRLIRVGRVLILFNKNIKMFTNFIKETSLDKLLMLVVITFISSSLAFFFIDESMSFMDSMWYVLVTLTTVGYGDIIPRSFIGRIIAVILIIVGILIFSITTAAISSIYTKRIEKETKDEISERLDRVEEKLDRLLNEMEKK